MLYEVITSIGITQIDIPDIVVQCPNGAFVHRDEAGKPCFDLLAAKFQRKTVLELQAPRATWRNEHLRGLMPDLSYNFV